MTLEKTSEALATKRSGEGLGRPRIELTRSVPHNSLAKSFTQYTPTRVDDPNLVERLKDIAIQRRPFGYRRLTRMLRREGFVLNHKHVYRTYNTRLVTRPSER
jgi:hypothetical protein